MNLERIFRLKVLEWSNCHRFKRFWWYNLAMAMNIKGKNLTPVEFEEKIIPTLLVITIKLGTQSCGFAYQTYKDFKENPQRVHSLMFRSGTIMRDDFPPALKLTGGGRAEEFGDEAIKQFEEIEEHEDYSIDYVFFENVIESLYISEGVNDDTLIKDSRGVRHRAIDIVGKFMKILVDYSFLKVASRASLKPSELKWVLMIPSVRAGSGVVAFFEKAWNEVFKNDTCRRESVSIVTFPDAALTYYSYLPPIQCNGISINKIKPGERVMLIGFEEELDSLNVYEKIEDRNFKQVVHFLSGASSKCLILKAVDSFFEDLIGSWIWKVAKRNYVDLWQDIVAKIDLLLMDSKMDTNRFVTFSHTLNLEKICDQHTNTTLKQILETSEYSAKIKYMIKTSKMRVESSLLKSIFEKGLSNIIRNIKQALAKPDDKKVNTFILAGNIAPSGLVIDAIKTAFSSQQIAVSDVAMEAALRGAVLSGHKPIVVSSIFSGAQVLVTR